MRCLEVIQDTGQLLVVGDCLTHGRTLHVPGPTCSMSVVSPRQIIMTIRSAPSHFQKPWGGGNLWREHGSYPVTLRTSGWRSRQALADESVESQDTFGPAGQSHSQVWTEQFGCKEPCFPEPKAQRDTLASNT